MNPAAGEGPRGAGWRSTARQAACLESRAGAAAAAAAAAVPRRRLLEDMLIRRRGAAMAVKPIPNGTYGVQYSGESPTQPRPRCHLRPRLLRCLDPSPYAGKAAHQQNILYPCV